MERTLLLIKPNATRKGKIGAILGMVEDRGFKIEKLKMIRMDNNLADRFYAEHIDKGFYAQLSAFMQSGDIVAAVLSRDDAITGLRELVGHTDYRQAAPGTIRALFGDSLTENAVHASDSTVSAKREIAIIFP
ncbi:MAG: nucleoside-diphosphate kinase [Candidatus Cloacimonetes bacterium]|nr:nucleoside-diphosphate kinase [Candidatus Cloacimonadota bacterium]